MAVLLVRSSTRPQYFCRVGSFLLTEKKIPLEGNVSLIICQSTSKYEQIFESELLGFEIDRIAHNFFENALEGLKPRSKMG